VTDAVVVARVIRSGVEESVHLGHVVACDVNGDVIAAAGDPARVVFARSSMKPLQAAVSMHVAGGDDLAEDEVAVMCASHNGEPVHVEAVTRILRRAGLDQRSLRCPPAWPWFPEDVRGAGERRRVFHNCSGKHAGMALACARAGLPLESYAEPDHPMQVAVLDAVRSFSGAEPVAIGVDGCGVPVHAMPLHMMAMLFARVASEEWTELLAAQRDRAVSAMRAHPYLVAGRDRLDTAVMETIDGIVVKTGAEGLVCAAVPASGFGVAVRVEDGSSRAAGPVLIAALHRLRVIDDEHLERLAPFSRPPVLGGGASVGAIVADVPF
jgi:L-asparaginase II